jgi:hypothetical protein
VPVSQSRTRVVRDGRDPFHPRPTARVHGPPRPRCNFGSPPQGQRPRARSASCRSVLSRLGRDRARISSTRPVRRTSAQRAGREHEARWRPPCAAPAVMDAGAVQAGSRRTGQRRLGFSAMGDDPRHDGLEVGSLGEDRRALDDDPPGGMGSAKSCQQRANRVVVHALQRNPPLRAPVVVTRSWRPMRRTRRAGCRWMRPITAAVTSWPPSSLTWTAAA